VPEPNPVLVPQDVPCQYHTSPPVGLPERVIVTPTVAHCGELSVGLGGLEGIELTVAVTAVLDAVTHPATLVASTY